MFTVTPSTLYVVATPIGNLQDITLRALDVLKNVDFIYAEDTRVTGKLLQRYEIKTKLRSYREAASPIQVEKMIAEVANLLYEEKSVAVVSDAGTPGVSDPGSHLVSKIWEAGYSVSAIPGPSALAAILSSAGFKAQKPLFVGFLPKKKGHQTMMKQLEAALVADLCDTIVLYESPERIVKLLEELQEWKSNLLICVGRELTKMHEEMTRGTTDEVLTFFRKKSQVKGEITVSITLHP